MNIKETLRSIALKYPKDLVEDQIRDLDRIAYHIGLVMERKGKDIKIADIGGGIGLFSVGCAAQGMRAVLVDDFEDEINQQVGLSILEIHKSYGVEVVCKDVMEEHIGLEPQSIDVITCFETMEHWHHSPKRLFHSLKTSIKPGGLFILGVPNCVDLKKRLMVPFGYGRWSAMRDWYERQVFRGHVREPDVNDLIYIAKDMDLKEVEILGRVWTGYAGSRRIFRFCGIMADRVLRLRPSLCSTLYLIGSI